MEKKCKTCGLTKGAEKFYRSKHEKNGVEYQCKKCSSERQKEQRKRNWEKILNHYGRKCFCCGVVHKEFLTIDHIKGDGAKHRKELNRGRLYAYIVREKFPKRFRLSCMNCNFAIGIHGYCPHKSKK
ncbi:MAG: hypothetical protein Q8N98_05415 [bacterium]|nr:hypothetical protein [bacterium]